MSKFPIRWGTSTQEDSTSWGWTFRAKELWDWAEFGRGIFENTSCKTLFYPVVWFGYYYFPSKVWLVYYYCHLLQTVAAEYPEMWKAGQTVCVVLLPQKLRKEKNIKKWSILSMPNKYIVCIISRHV